MGINKTLFTALFFLASFFCAAQQVVSVLDSVDQHIFTYREIEYLEDPAGRLTIDQISSDTFNGKFTVNTKYKPENESQSTVFESE